ncbi:50S ribosomal protein L4 [Planctomycetales bacterium]|nr:50S ribosomal protein L4 [Planctomycetales bacterium]
MELSVYNQQGEPVETISFDESCLGKFVNYDLLHQAIVAFQANQRLGTHYTKNRRAIICRKGKPFKQKGTGNARMGYRGRVGSRGGAVAHGPKPRDYRLDMPRQAKRAALKSALLGKLREQEVVVVNSLPVGEQPKTKEIATVIKNLKIDRSCLLVTSGYNENLYKSVRNLPRVEILPLTDLHAYAVLKPDRLLFTKEALLAVSQEVK